MKNKICLLLIAVSFSCSSTKTSGTESSTKDETYGYSESNPVKVGGFESGPANERNYLNSLSSPNGEKLVYSRNGSCCGFKTKNSPFGMGMLIG